MKGEILRRMSMEIIKDEKLEHNTTKNDVENDKTEDDDYLVKTIGAFGLWQATVSITAILTRLVALWNMMSLTFLTPVIEFVCVEFSDNMTTEVINSTCYANCLKYKYSSLIGKSITEEFGLICQNVWMASFAQSVLMLGILVGVSIFGWISDRYGRRKAMLQSIFLNAVFMIALPFSPSYIIFTSIRFMIGITTGGCLIISVVYVMEIIGKKYREIAGACCLIPDGLATATLAGFAYFTSDWQGFTLCYGVATCLIFVLIFFVPESPRWLVSHGKVDEAISIITSAANRNKLRTSHIKDEITQAVESLKIQNPQIVKTSYLDFFKSKSLFTMTVTVSMMWFAQGMCYYGIYQYVTIIGVDPYLSVVILGLIEIPFSPMGVILNWKFGRKISSIAISFGIAGTMFILIFFPKGDWLGTMLGVFAFICCTIYFSISYIYVSELFPTPLRNMSLAFASAGARIGAMIAPFVANLSPSWLPALIFGIVPMIGALCCFTLPETKGRNLRDTVSNKL